MTFACSALIFRSGKLKRNGSVVFFHNRHSRRDGLHAPARLRVALSHSHHQLCHLIHQDGDSRLGANDRPDENHWRPLGLRRLDRDRHRTGSGIRRLGDHWSRGPARSRKQRSVARRRQRANGDGPKRIASGRRVGSGSRVLAASGPLRHAPRGGRRSSMVDALSSVAINFGRSSPALCELCAVMTAKARDATEEAPCSSFGLPLSGYSNNDAHPRTFRFAKSLRRLNRQRFDEEIRHTSLEIVEQRLQRRVARSRRSRSGSRSRLSPAARRRRFATKGQLRRPWRPPRRRAAAGLRRRR